MQDQKKQVTPEEAAAELIRRRKARGNFADYVEYVSGFPVPRHSKLLCRLLEEVMAGKNNRLMVFMPPGHAKSFYISRHFPAYYLSKFSKNCVIAATHTDDFAGTWGRRVRNLFETTQHQALFPSSGIAEDSRASGRWETSDGGEYNAAGVGSNIAGRRADLALIDDPIPTAEAADSRAVRDKVWDWYGSDLYPRIKGKASIIIVSTRWTIDDLPGRLLESQNHGGERWKVLSLPAIAGPKDQLGRKEGEALWPEEYPIERLLTIKQQPSTSPRRWAALYQQSPVIESGNLIKRTWFKIWPYAERPRVRFVLQSYDTAVTSKQKSAFSVALTMGVFDEPETGLPAIILMSRWRGRVDYPDLRKRAQRLAKDYLDDKTFFADDGTVLDSGSGVNRPPDRVLIEDAPVGKPLISDLMRAGIEGVTRFPTHRYGDKDSRIMLAADIFESGRFYVLGMGPSFVTPLRWCEDFISSMISYPAADARDDVDACSQGIIWLKTNGWVKNPSDPTWEPQRARKTEQRARFY